MTSEVSPRRFDIVAVEHVLDKVTTVSRSASKRFEVSKVDLRCEWKHLKGVKVIKWTIALTKAMTRLDTSIDVASRRSSSLKYVTALCKIACYGGCRSSA